MINKNGLEIPDEHFADALKLEEAEGYVDLFKITLNDNVTHIRLKLNDTVNWQGDVYEGTGIKIDGVAKYSDDQTSRPSLSIFNPDNIFSAPASKGFLEGSLVTRYRVLRSHLDSDMAIFRSQRWFVRRISSLRTPVLTLELRDLMDGHQFMVPGRMFIPPDFPSVSLR